MIEENLGHSLLDALKYPQIITTKQIFEDLAKLYDRLYIQIQQEMKGEGGDEENDEEKG